MAWAKVENLGHVRCDPRTGRWYIDLRRRGVPDSLRRIYTYRAPWGEEAPFHSQREAQRAHWRERIKGRGTTDERV